jgi:hypothetical protein
LLRDAARLIRAARDALDAAAELRDLAGLTTDDALAESAAALIRLFEQCAGELAELAVDVDSALAELAPVVAHGTGSDRLACQAARARLSCTDDHVADAISGYLQLLEHRDVFPEAAMGLLEAGAIDVDRAFADSDPATAVSRIGALREPLAAASDTRVDWTVLNAREAIARFWLGEAEIGRARFADAVAALGDNPEWAGRNIGNLWRALVPSSEAYWRIADQLAAPRDDALRAAADCLDHYPDDVLGCAQYPQSDPEFTVCELTIGSALVPSDRGPDSELFTDLLPAMHEELEAKYGIIVGLVSVAEDVSIGQGEYRIGLFGVEVAAGEVSLDAPGPLAMVIQRLTEVLREHKSVLCCLDRTNELLIRWSADNPELTRQPLNDDTAMVALNMVLRALLNRDLSIADGRAVLETFAEVGSEDGVMIDDLVDECARRLTPAPEMPL